VSALAWALEPLRTALPLLLGGLAVALAFIKLAVVLAVLRRGLGGGVPPASVTALLALILAALVMAPTADRCQRAVAALPPTASSEEVLQAGAAPLREFLDRHTPPGEKQTVLDLTQRLAPRTAEPLPAAASPLTVLTAAYALSQLRLAFLLGFGLLLPFLLIDLLCAVLLSGLDAGGLSPRGVALPFKLLLLVVGNGWQLILRGLLSGYA
jgi:flagellar biosynthetic protein FliP